MSATLLILLPVLVGTTPNSRIVTLEQALESTRNNNITWKSLAEFIEQADAGRDIGIAMYLPKLTADGQWMRLDERNTPDFDTSALEASGLATAVLADIVCNPATGTPDARCVQLAQLANQDDAGSGASFDDFVPPQDKLSATFSLVVPVINPTAIPIIQGAYDRYASTVQRIGHSREQLLFGVAKAYYGLVTMQKMLEVADRSIDTAQHHYQSNKVKAGLQAATQLEVKRAELEITKAESQKAELSASLEKAKAVFGYMSGIEGPFAVVEPTLEKSDEERSLKAWLATAKKERKDLAAARIEVLAADHDVDGAWAAYLPNLNLVGSAMVDNAKAQRFDNDPWAVTFLATVSLNVWDGGIREAQLKMKKASFRQAEYAAEDLELKIDSEVKSAKQALSDTTASRVLAARQLDVARDTQALTKASEEAGVVTNLEVIDVNTMVWGSEANYLAARLTEAMAYLDLLAAAGQPVPF